MSFAAEPELSTTNAMCARARGRKLALIVGALVVISPLSTLLFNSRASALPQSWRAWPLYVRPPLAAYATGRVALAGDAAHPMVPFLAQGAAQAIEDAGALAHCLAGAPDVAAALAAYSAQRAPRAGRVQQEALTQAKIYHMSGPLALARDLAMRLAGPERLIRRYDWLYGA